MALARPVKYSIQPGGWRFLPGMACGDSGDDRCMGVGEKCPRHLAATMVADVLRGFLRVSRVAAGTPQEHRGFRRRSLDRDVNGDDGASIKCLKTALRSFPKSASSLRKTAFSLLTFCSPPPAPKAPRGSSAELNFPLAPFPPPGYNPGNLLSGDGRREAARSNAAALTRTHAKASSGCAARDCLQCNFR
jgi:hypothetical protein